MYLSFLDESGIFKESKYFMLGITTLSEKACRVLKKGLRDIKIGNGIPPNVEIKWNLEAFNRQLSVNNVGIYNLDSHKKLKSEILKLIGQFRSEDVSIMWYLSPLFFFRQDAWRSYKYAFTDSLVWLSENLEIVKQNTVALIDELGNLGRLNKIQRRQLVEDLVLTLNNDDTCENINLIIPNVDSTLSFGHQLNDIILGILNSYVTQLHSDHHKGISDDIVKALKSMKECVVKIMIKPVRPNRMELLLLNTKTYNNLRKDLS